MKLGQILGKVGSSIIRNVVPGGGVIIDLVNGFLPQDKKLPETATGHQATQAINSLPPEVQQGIVLKELDVEIAEINAWADVQRSLADADKAGASTRPQIALMMAKVVAFVVIAFVSILIASIFLNRVDMIKQLKDYWPLALAIIGTPTALLRSYFAMRTKEKKERYHMVSGQFDEPSSSIWGDIISAVKR